MAGAILHDAGKIYDCDWSGLVINMTDRGRLLGHITQGMMLVDQHAKDCPDLSVGRLNLLLHLVARGANYTLSEQVLVFQQAELVPAPAPKLAENESMVLEYVKLNGYITNALCRELLGIDDKDSANYILTNMFKKGLLKRTGRGKGTRYLI